MSDIIATTSSATLISPEILEQVITGDLSKLTAPQRVEYLLGVCKSLGLNPATRPFDYVILNGKLTLDEAAGSAPIQPAFASMG